MAPMPDMKPEITCVGHLGDVTPKAEHTKKNLEEPGEDHHGEGHRHRRFFIRRRGRKAQDH
jgi:hypothetical protein